MQRTSDRNLYLDSFPCNFIWIPQWWLRRLMVQKLEIRNSQIRIESNPTRIAHWPIERASLKAGNYRVKGKMQRRGRKEDRQEEGRMKEKRLKKRNERREREEVVEAIRKWCCSPKVDTRKVKCQSRREDICIVKWDERWKVSVISSKLLDENVAEVLQKPTNEVLKMYQISQNSPKFQY